MTNPLLNEFIFQSGLKLKNKIVMAPMTRAHAQADFTATEAMMHYYAARADAGLIITEGTIISRNARGHDCVPGLFTPEHITAWQRVTDAVHSKNGNIFSQLWHVGRVSHPYFLDGELPLSASATEMHGHIPRSKNLEFGAARAATQNDINELLEHFHQAAKNANAAGFDGIEIHAANGYLLDQFMHHHTNLRTDDYGVTPENMSRLMLQVIDACASAIGMERVAIRLTPGAYMNEIIGEARDAENFKYLLQRLSQLNMAYVHTGNMDHTRAFPELGNMTMTAFMRQHYQGTLIAAGNYNIANAISGLENKEFDLVAFGRPFIANPDLITKTTQNIPWRDFDVSMLATLV